MKTKFTELIMLVTFCLISITTKAQLNYLAGGFSTFAGTYSDLGSTGTIIPVSNSDDAFSSPQYIGFTFNFNGASYDSFVLNTNGFIKLGRDTASSHLLYTDFFQPPPGGPFSSASMQDTSLIVPFGQDLWGGPATPEFRMSVVGFPGTRQCIIQWKNLRDKLQGGPTLTTTTQYDTINFQCILFEGSNAIEFVFGRWVPSTNTSGARFAACGLKGRSNLANQLLTVTKGSAISWSNLIINSGNYATNALNYGNNVVTGRPAPDVGRTYHFHPVVTNDLSVNWVKSTGKIALPYYSPDIITANITNQGINTVNNIPVSLTINGTNYHTATSFITSLAPSTSVNVTFSPYLPLTTGSNLVSVSVPNDDNNSNNTEVYSHSISNRTLSYVDTTKAVGQSYSGSNTIFSAQYRITNTGMITSTRHFILSNSGAVGVTVYGVVLDSVGTIIAQSTPYVLQASDMGSWVNFNFPNPPIINNSFFYAGMACGPIVSTTYFLGTIQNEVAARAETCVTFGLNGGVPTFPAYGRFMTECKIDPIPPVDVGVSAAIPSNGANIPTNTNLNLRAVVKNFGTQTRSPGLQVWYNVNNGALKGPVLTAVSLNQGDTTSVYFTGTNALNIASLGANTIKFFTTLSGDMLPGNDTLSVTYNSVAGINTFPYRLANNILNNWTPANNNPAIWKQGTAIQPNGISNSSLLYMDNYNVIGDARVISPIFNFSSLNNPILHFNVAHAPTTTFARYDTLEVLVSTDGGYTFNSVYTKVSQISQPPLGTVNAMGTQYTPNLSTDWRQDAVNLSSYANNPFVIIAFRGKSASGNNVYISNISITNPNQISTQLVNSATIYYFGNFSVYFPNTIGALGGELTFCKYNNAPTSAASPVFATNTTATTASSGIFTPSNVSQDAFWTASYSGTGTGNLASSIPYVAFIDYAGMAGVSNPDSVYILKRSEHNSSWVAQSTNRSLTSLSTNYIYGFSDFVLGSQASYNALPVKWLNFSVQKNQNNAVLNWKTTNEINNNYFEIERSTNNLDFITIGITSANKKPESVNNYSFTDKDLGKQATTFYYRIKQVDIDTKFSYSKTLTLNLLDNESVKLYPNPFKENLNLSFNEVITSNIGVKIYNLNGLMVVNREYKNNQDNALSLDNLEQLKNGIYFIDVSFNGKTNHYKLLKTSN